MYSCKWLVDRLARANSIGAYRGKKAHAGGAPPLPGGAPPLPTCACKQVPELLPLLFSYEALHQPPYPSPATHPSLTPLPSPAPLLPPCPCPLPTPSIPAKSWLSCCPCCSPTKRSTTPCRARSCCTFLLPASWYVTLGHLQVVLLSINARAWEC